MPNVQYWSFGNQNQSPIPFTQDDPAGYLSIKSRAGRSDWQWKTVLSWMPGIAGTRRVLAEEGYVYIAPCSAFYPERKLPVETSLWHPYYPPSALEIKPDPNSGSHLRPDYIAIRQSSNVEFALVEGKRTFDCLTSMRVCPSRWSRQVRNAIVRVNGTPIRYTETHCRSYEG